MLPLNYTNVRTRLLEVQKCLQSHDPVGAVRLLEQGELTETGVLEAEILAARAYFALPNRGLCLAHLDRLERMAPNNVKIGFFCFTHYRELNCMDRAFAVISNLAKSNPDDIKVQAALGQHLQVMGRFGSACRHFSRIIKKFPANPQLYRIALATQNIDSERLPVLQQMIACWQRKDLPDVERLQLGFAIGKALDDLGDAARAMEFLKIANEMQRDLHPYDSNARRREWNSFRSAQEPMRPMPKAERKFSPIFLCGMPRSGTTLIERQFIQKSGVQSAGEIPHALAEAYRVFVHKRGVLPIKLATEADLAEYADQYERLVKRGFEVSGERIVDKSIKSYLVWGYAFYAMPQARSIVVHRDARDIALSIYRNFFTLGTHRYGNRFADIAGEIKAFRAAIAHWKKLFPERIYEIRYEDFVAAPEASLSQLSSFVGAPDASPGSLPARQKPITTLSVAQAREPVHQRRLEAWRSYEPYLKDFLAAWGDDPF